MSRPSRVDRSQNDLLKSRLSSQLNPKNPLYMLADSIDWEALEAELTPYFPSISGHPPKPIRLMAGLFMLQHMEGLSDERVVALWVENPYWQYFCGFDHFQWSFPIDSSSLSRWRQRLTEKGIEQILSCTIKTSLEVGHVKEEDLTEVISDTTVMEKAITFPTDS